MKCDKCGKDIPEQIDYCPSCKVVEKKIQTNREHLTNEDVNAQEKQIQTEEEIKQIAISHMQKNNKWATISFITSIISFFIFSMTPLFWLIAAIIADNELPLEIGKWFMRFVFILPWITNAISLIAGIIGLYSKKRIFAIIGLIFTIIVIMLYYYY